MAAQKDAKRKSPAAKPEAEEVPTEAREALAGFQAEAEQERQARAKTEKELTDARGVLAATQAKVEQEHQARVKAEKALTETREDLDAAQEELEQEQRARIEMEKAMGKTKEALATAQAEIEQERQARVEAERALTDTKEALAAVRKELKREERSQAKIGRSEDEEVKTKEQARKSEEAKTRHPQPPPKEMGAVEPHTFTVKMTVDERGEPGLITVKHANSDKEDSFRGLDTQRLVAFMGKCIRPPGMRGPGIASEALSISDVRVFRVGGGDATALFLNPHEPFLVQVRLQFGGAEARSLTAEQPPFEVKLHARELKSGTSTELATYSGNLAKDVLEYTARLQVRGLPHGLYRLRTLVRLQPPINVTREYAGPVIDLT